MMLLTIINTLLAIILSVITVGICAYTTDMDTQGVVAIAFLVCGIFVLGIALGGNTTNNQLDLYILSNGNGETYYFTDEKSCSDKFFEFYFEEDVPENTTTWEIQHVTIGDEKNGN